MCVWRSDNTNHDCRLVPEDLIILTSWCRDGLITYWCSVATPPQQKTSFTLIGCHYTVKIHLHYLDSYKQHTCIVPEALIAYVYVYVYICRAVLVAMASLGIRLDERQLVMNVWTRLLINMEASIASRHRWPCSCDGRVRRSAICPLNFILIIPAARGLA